MITLLDLDKYFISFCKNHDLSVRPNASNGFWVSFLLPISIILTITAHPDSPENYRLGFFFAFGLILATLVFIFTLDEDNFSWKILIIPSALTSTLLIVCMKRGVFFSIFFSCLTCFTFRSGLVYTIKQFPKSFTFGEAAIFTQSCIIFILKYILNFYEVWYHAPRESLEISTIVLQTGLFGVAMIVYFCSFIKKNNTFLPYVIIGGVTFGFVIPILNLLLNQNPLFWVFEFLTRSLNSFMLFGAWALASICAVATVTLLTNESSQADTVTRKYFHALAVLVFTSGIILDPIMLYLASGVVLAIFIILELIMALELPPFGESLRASFNFFGDDKDVGVVAFSPLYLLIGCSFSLWIHPFPLNPHKFQVLFCGILSIGIGDSCASIFGKYYGRHFWKGTKRTYEGTLGFITGQFLVLLMIYLSDFFYQDFLTNTKMIFGILISSLIEAKTDQVDNLVLPILMYIFVV